MNLVSGCSVLWARIWMSPVDLFLHTCLICELRSPFSDELNLKSFFSHQQVCSQRCSSLLWLQSLSLPGSPPSSLRWCLEAPGSRKLNCSWQHQMQTRHRSAGCVHSSAALSFNQKSFCKQIQLTTQLEHALAVFPSPLATKPCGPIWAAGFSWVYHQYAFPVTVTLTRVMSKVINKVPTFLQDSITQQNWTVSGSLPELCPLKSELSPFLNTLHLAESWRKMPSSPVGCSRGIWEGRIWVQRLLLGAAQWKTVW